MPLKSVVSERCRAFLAAGEEIRYLFPAMSLMISGMQLAAGYLVVVTERRVVVLACSRWRRNAPQSVWADHPRGTRLGPVEVHPSLGPTVRIGDLTLEVDEEYVPVIRAADLELDGGRGSPEDPLPDL
ncbi:putative class III extradiol MEMO1 family dioxygenase [Amycolatopsis bartoniae]|uniref:Uncharacterized protein n=1 Tax=Amycolatopsis bartoniae TaxID=941986 RepID=A0A8H9IQW3_9PSEU|nr:hypothetical protein [Amycolatopsis bartoniae]MBB2934309.1 putative class III extradiol MEMO1 family dioxygenase [Amycolatopsis bartoniae]TVT00133.1 hypothetical protein FNH07_32580 [Amycolatopsis bartoniae]GHF48294.1 hypothetical protein GCM10017566_22020 [Amycolatopsis bartoniae]